MWCLRMWGYILYNMHNYSICHTIYHITIYINTTSMACPLWESFFCENNSLRIWTGCSFCSRSFRSISISIRIRIRISISIRDVVFEDVGFENNSLRSVFKISSLFLRPRLWQFEIRDSTDR